MKRLILLIWMTILIAGCATVTATPAQQPVSVTDTPPLSTPEAATVPPVLTEAVTSPTALATDDIFTQMGINLPAPVCTTLTQPQTEGPYYTPDTPERNSLLEEGMPGTRLILVGYVLDQNCNPLPNAWLDFWQADTEGEYDNQGYRLRGHQFTDAQGRYYLETILPGLYLSRPIEHIHVKVKPDGGQEITSQLYFPNQPIDGLTVTLEERGEYMVGYFNFVVQR
jgi:protocatechuate 3,4-dioxygenase beta subunit